MRIGSVIVTPKKIYDSDVGMSRPGTLPDVSKRKSGLDEYKRFLPVTLLTNLGYLTYSLACPIQVSRTAVILTMVPSYRDGRKRSRSWLDGLAA
jgi:hypothetical protein